jgi:transcription-repair coupling factor (superfamily II helicase)
VLQELDDLGAGFRLAAHDLEIRGAGNLLGKAQSGHIGAVGFDMFLRMMEEATQEVRGIVPDARVEPEVELGTEAFLPDWYVGDVGERLLLYRRLAGAEDPGAVDALADELEDRFGSLPREAKSFVRIMRLRPALRRLLVSSLKASDGVVALRFDGRSPVRPEVLLELAARQPRRFRLRPEGVLMMTTAGAGQGAGWDAMVTEIETLLGMLERGETGGSNDGRNVQQSSPARNFRRAVR